MITTMRILPAALAALFLGAHFLRAGSLLLLFGCLALGVLPFVRNPASRLLVRLALAAGAVEWIATAWRLARLRAADGRPSGRMLLILGALAAFTALAAWVLPPSRPREDQPLDQVPVQEAKR